MADHENSGPAEAVKGVVEDVKGKVKEAAGALAGRDDLTREGQAQQDKAEAQRDAANALLRRATPYVKDASGAMTSAGWDASAWLTESAKHLGDSSAPAQPKKEG